jgi:hypothetical protein
MQLRFKLPGAGWPLMPVCFDKSVLLRHRVPYGNVDTLMSNIVYIFTNEAMPGLVKIGLTTAESIESRIAQLSAATGIPLPFECYFAAEVKDCEKLEETLHELFSESRINPKREFFRVDPEKVVLAISIGDFKEVTPGATQIDQEEQEALEKIKAQRPRLRLDALGIKPGDTLTCSRDDKITATVVDGNKVDFNGEVLSLSAAALKALHSLGYSTPAASGSWYWKFEGELLDERRQRLEAEKFDDVPLADANSPD